MQEKDIAISDDSHSACAVESFGGAKPHMGDRKRHEDSLSTFVCRCIISGWNHPKGEITISPTFIARHSY